MGGLEMYLLRISVGGAGGGVLSNIQFSDTLTKEGAAKCENSVKLL